MLFNSIDFAVFLPLVFLLYWTVFNRTLRLQNGFLLVVSAVFYGWWDWRYLGLVFISAAIDYVVAISLDGTSDEKRRRWLLTLSMVANLGMLGFFKYCDFFITSFNDAFTFMGMPIGLRTLNIVLPVGISFYTFQTMSYTIDVYRKQIKASHDPIAFSAYILFFPQLVAGPIERAGQFLPQFHQHRTFDLAMARDGLRQILWGLFKKVVIADNCAPIVNSIYGDIDHASGSAIVLATVLFAFQVYGDFSGYSDIAIGSARLLGFSLMRNFAYPYFSRDIAEFWRRWHISLSTWFRDYLYIPLGGSRGGKWMAMRNSLIIFTVSGFWHGAAWNFVLWGLINGLYFIPLVWTDKTRQHMEIVAKGRTFPTLSELGRMLITFMLVCTFYVIFRSQGLGGMYTAFSGILSASLFTIPSMLLTKPVAITLGASALMFLFEWSARERAYGLMLDPRIPAWGRYGIYYGLVLIIVAFAPMAGGEFIYFQF
ncbi:MAG: MBOAT family O-acyltransferase [Flavobacteriales bacterium]|jgi:D-alanyl-lipoteichoic acid acyltransferase DltB (MBOAT superfamily)